MSKLTHRGANDHRLQDSKNRREAVFAKQWRELNRLNPNFLSSLLGREATQQDAEVAATVLQYLGTREGFKELEEMIKKSTGLIKI
jgi:hypothetical protein